MPISRTLLAADAVQEEELHGVAQRLGAIAFQLLIQKGQGVAHGLGAHFFTEELSGQAFEFPGAHTVEKKPADGSVHIPAPVFIAMQNGELHAARVQARHLDSFDGAEPGKQVADVVSISIPLAPGAPFIRPGPNPVGDFFG